MAAYKKTLEKMARVPTPSDVKWSDLSSALIHIGYQEISGAGSRVKFYHKGKDALICCHKPHPSPEVDKGCIADVVNHLKEHKFI